MGGTSKLDLISNQVSLVVLIISILTGTFLGNINDGKNSILKKCNYYALVVCALFILILVEANKEFLHDFNEEIVSIILLIYLILYFGNYIVLSLSYFCKNDEYPISVRCTIITILVIILSLVFNLVWSIEVESYYIPKDTIVRVCDSNSNYFFIKTEKDTPIKIKNLIDFKSNYNQSFKFTAPENKVVLKENTKIGLLEFSTFLLHETEDENPSYIKDWIVFSNENEFTFDSGTTFSLNKNIDVTLTKDTVLTIYYNSVLKIIRLLVLISMIFTIIVELVLEKFIRKNPKKMKRGRKRKRNRMVNEN